MQSPTCATCPFFRPVAEENQGTCHVNPPTVNHSGFGQWPKIGYWQVCSEHPDAPMRQSVRLLAQMAAALESPVRDPAFVATGDSPFAKSVR